jgi:putative ABC transport system substrate-binding protein
MLKDTIRMKRREFITLLGSAATAWPLAATAQSSNGPIIGALQSGTPTGYWLQHYAAFRRGLYDAGYAEGRNLRIEARWAEDHYDRLPAMATDLVQQNVAAIAAFTTAQSAP